MHPDSPCQLSRSLVGGGTAAEPQPGLAGTDRTGLRMESAQYFRRGSFWRREQRCLEDFIYKDFREAQNRSEERFEPEEQKLYFSTWI